MKVRRVLEYEGTEEWVKRTLEKSYVQKDGISFPNIGTIREMSREVIKEDKDVPLPDHDGGDHPVS